MKIKRNEKARKSKPQSRTQSTAGKAKAAGKKAVQAAKSYSGKMKRAYDDGFAAGFEAAQNMPKVTGARAAAVIGFNNGARARQRSEKSKKKYTGIRAKGKS